VKKCGKFIYGGCGGNENNFATLEDCHKRCRPNIPGTCSMSMQIDMTGFELTTLVVIGTDFIGSCKSFYHMIMTTPAPKCLYKYVY
jgi:hypothetical protein